jgi:hypothetical protein
VIQAEINANLQQISSLQSQLSTGTTVTGVTTPTQTTVIQPSTPVTVTNEGGSGASVSFSGYTWTPISVSYGSLSSFGDWYVDPSTNFLHEDAISPLHYKVVASMLPASDVDVQATVSMEQGTEMGVCARMDAAGNGYCFATSWGGGTYPQIGKFSNGDQNPMGIASAQTPSPIAPNTNYIVELRVQGSSISGRIYQAGTTAPTAWTAQTTDNSFTSGAVGFYSYGSQPVIKSVTVTQLMNTSTSSASSTSSSSGTTTAE